MCDNKWISDLVEVLSEFKFKDSINQTFQPVDLIQEPISYQYCFEILKYQKNHPNDFEMIQDKFKLIQTRNCIKRCQKYVQKLGCFNYKKYLMINKYVLREYKEFSSKGYQLDEDDLKEFAFTKARDLNLHTFKPTDKWLLEFKIKNKIKINKPNRYFTF